MSSPGPLTILLTLKDRTPFTHRWMRYMNDLKCPYPILIADGGEDQAIEAHLRDAAHYPSLSYSYLRYPIDRDYTTYHRKFADAISKVSTPYVLLADNDDFFLLDPLPAFIAVLDAEADVVSCGGPSIVLRLLSRDQVTVHEPTAPGYRAVLETRSTSIADDDPIDRVCYLLAYVERRRLWNTWYYVHRTSALAAAARVIAEYDFRDPVTLEMHVHLSLLMRGKYRQLDTPAYVRQHGTSQVTADIRARGNMVERFAATNAMADFDRSIASWPRACTAGERARVEEAIAAWFAEESGRLYPKKASLARRLARRLVAPFRQSPPAPAAPVSLRLPLLEKYILTSST